ncbi:MAG: class I SAM-dependent methyltransferase [Bacteroidia bacterium]|nr:class I SAM-dependent methyltransferase [Bacteroidia bacterium]
MKKQTKKTEKQNERIALDLGCGQNKIAADFFENNLQVKIDHVIGVDFVKCEGVDKVHDLSKFPYPFIDESVDAIFTSHFLEHLDGFERAKFMDECYRILKPSGKMRFIHPYYKSVRAVQDFTHKWPPISEHSYLYFDKNWRTINKLTHGPYNLKCDYEFNIYYTWQDPIWANKNEETRNFAVNHYFNVVADMVVDLKKR